MSPFQVHFVFSPLFALLVALLVAAIVLPVILVLHKKRVRKIQNQGNSSLYTLVPLQSEISNTPAVNQNTKQSVQPNIAKIPNTPVAIVTKAYKSPGPSTTNDEKLEITDEFQFAIDAMEKTHNCIFVTGEAGTGKSTLLKYFIKTTKKKIVVIAPTGVAAMNVGGQTIHSFFKFPPRPITASDIKVSSQGELCKVLGAIIIDEISMVRADLLDGIDKFLRLNGRDFTKPFGGIQLIFFGDLFQLPPIVSTLTEGQFFGQYYKSPYFFDAHVFSEININVIKLKQVYRQRETTFVEILNRIRTGRYTDIDLQKLNERYDSRFEPTDGDGYITLTTTNKLADAKNRGELEKLSTKEYTYVGIVEGDFDPKSYPADLVLGLKVGAQVMFVKNDSERRWVNGTVGFIEELSDNKIIVRIPTPIDQPPLIHEIKQQTWKVISYRLNHTSRSIDSDVVGSFTQYPLRSAWAITIHKSQGRTFDKVVINLGSGAFAHGQAYVALSRCILLNNMVLKQRLRRQDIIIDGKVFGFLEKLSVFPE